MMRATDTTRRLLLLAGGVVAASGCASVKAAEPVALVEGAMLAGKWKVELKPAFDSAPTYTELVVTPTGRNTFGGSFYYSDFSDGLFDPRPGFVAFAFVTSDGQGFYNTSGKMFADGRVEGMTHAVARKFLMSWTAVRA